MKYLYTLIVVFSIISLSSCRDDFDSLPNTGTLEFSRDTVYLDTVFTNIGSSTYNLKVYNRSNEDINIPTLRLGNGENSKYRLNVDGLPGRSFNNIQVLAKDSIFIFVETTIDINDNTNNNEFLYTDQILFEGGSNQQKVELVTLVKDAVFLFPADLGNGIFETLNLGTDPEGNNVLIQGFFLDDNELTFTNEKPYVIYGYAAVPPTKTLNIQPGARINFHFGGGILVANNASIKALGAPSDDPIAMENQIIFEGDRLEPDFADVPGQWGTIWCTSGSTNNQFEYVTIKNSTVGILMENNDGDETLTLRNVQIYNSTNVGLLARTGNIYGENVVINNSGQTSLSCSFGGSYEFNHCTFANYWTQGFRQFPAVAIDNVFDTGETLLTTDLIKADFTNCIIYGNERRELSLFRGESGIFNFNFRNSLIRFEDPQGDFADNPLYDFNNVSLFSSCVFNEDPAFQNVVRNNFNIESGVSGAEGIGFNPTPVTVDLNNVLRSNPSDAGAYEATNFPED